MTEILAAVAYGADEPFALERLTLGPIRDDEVLVRVHATGICHTDILAKNGILPFKLPAVLGHEGAGVIEAVGAEVTKVSIGDHVVMTFDYCGRCPQCQGEQPAYCAELLTRIFGGCRMDGSGTLENDTVTAAFFAQSSFATHAIAREQNVVPVPKDLDLAVLGQLGCGVQTGAGAVLNRLDAAPDSSLLVCGVGTVGMSAVMAARVVGCERIIALDVMKQRLDLARELGATHVIDTTSADWQEELDAASPGGVTNAVDTTARQDVISVAFEHLAPRGTLVLLGAGAEPQACFNVHELVSGGRSVCGVAEGDSAPDVFIPQLIELYQTGLFPIDRLVARYPLKAINDACAAASAGDVIKPVLIMPEEIQS